jgi:hypothetical protein
MLQDFRVYRTPTDYLHLPLDQERPYLVKGIDGLGPVPSQITENYMSYANQYSHDRHNVDQRIIAVTLGLTDDHYGGLSVQQLRNQLYFYLPLHSEVTLWFQDDVIGQVQIKGRVESLTPAIFTKEPEVVVTVVCPDPYFSALTEIVIANPVRGANNTYEIEYLGSAPVGYKFDIIPSGGTISTINFDGFRMAQSIPSGQKVAVSTIPGDKYVRRYANLTTTSYNRWTKYVNYLTDWGTLLLYPGLNVKTMSWSGTTANPFKNIRWTPKYLSL